MRVDSLGSIWRFDDDLGRYMRTPRVEAPREHPEWGDERAGPCQDFIWHELDSWWVTSDGKRLVVVPVSFGPFWVPLTPDVNDMAFDVWGAVIARNDGTYERVVERLVYGNR